MGVSVRLHVAVDTFVSVGEEEGDAVWDSERVIVLVADVADVGDVVNECLCVVAVAEDEAVAECVGDREPSECVKDDVSERK